MQNKYSSFISNTIMFAFGNLISKLFLFILLPVYTRYLSTVQYGVAEMLITVAQTSVSIFSLCVSEATFRFGIEKDNKNVLKNSLIVALASTICIFLAQSGLVLYKPLAPYRLFLGIIASLELIRGILSIYTQSQKKLQLFSLDNILYTLVLCIANIVLLIVLRTNIYGYFFAIIIANTFSIVFLTILGGYAEIILVSHYDKVLLKKMLKYSSPMVVNSVAWSINGLFDRTMLTSLCSERDTGIYSAATKIPSILSLVTGVVTQAWTISSIQEYQGEKDKTFYSNIFASLHVTILSVAFVVFILNNNLVVLFLGEEFKEASSFVPVLIVGAVFWAYANFFTAVFQTTMESKFIMVSTVGSALINVIMNVSLIPKFWVMGACIATTMSYVYISLYRMIKGLKLISFEIDYSKLLVSIVLLLISAVLTTVKLYSIIVSVAAMAIVIIMYKSYILSITQRLYMLAKASIFKWREM